MRAYLILFILLSLSCWSKKLDHLINPASVPLQIYNEKTQAVTGIFSEILDGIFGSTQYSLNPVVAPQSRLFMMYKMGRFGTALTYGSPLWFDGDFIGPELFKWKQFLVIHKSSIEKYENLKSLYGKSLVLIKGYSYPDLEKHISKDKSRINVSWMENNESALNFLNHKRADGFISGEIRLKYYLKQSKLKKEDYLFIDLSAEIDPVSIHVWVSENASKDIRELINSKLISMKSEKKIKEILEKYR